MFGRLVGGIPIKVRTLTVGVQSMADLSVCGVVSGGLIVRHKSSEKGALCMYPIMSTLFSQVRLKRHTNRLRTSMTVLIEKKIRYAHIRY